MKKEVKIGIFTIIVILGAWGGVRFLSGSDIFSSDKTYYATYDDIDGLQNSSPIYIKGVKVGSVSDIKLDLAKSSKVLLTLTIMDQFHIPKDSQAKIFSDGLIGSKAIDLTIGSSGEYLNDGDTIASVPSVGLFDVAGEEIKYLKQKIDKLTGEISTTMQNLNNLMESNAEHLNGTIKNLDALSYNLNQLIVDNRANVTSTFEGFSTFSQAIGENSANIESIIQNIDSLTQDLNEADIDTTVQEVNALLAKFNSTEGNIGKVINDDAIYENLSSASKNLDSLLFDFKKNPKRYVHFSIFGRKNSKEIKKAEKRAAKEVQ